MFQWVGAMTGHWIIAPGSGMLFGMNSSSIVVLRPQFKTT
jgi:hypothetical protein